MPRPARLNMSRDDCRRTLRRLELEAYGAAVSALRAQGALEGGRRRLLEELRAALRVGADRHAAEARRAANDELLATVADTLSGPNTGLGWVSEGRRRVPLMPRGIPQTAYTELADKIALQISAENQELKRKLEAKRMIAPKSNEDSEMADAEGLTAEDSLTHNLDDEMLYPPIVMEDQSIKLLEMELFSRKRKVPETGVLPEDLAATPVKNIKNTSRGGNQKHLNLSQIYSNFSKPPTSAKMSSQSKHSYNQVSKVSSKSNSTAARSRTEQHTPRSEKSRSRKQSHGKSREPKSKAQHISQHNIQMDTPISSKSYNLNPMTMPIQMDYSQPPPTFQASYAQSIQLMKPPLYGDDVKPQQNLMESPTMQLLAQPATVPHELSVNHPLHTDDPSSLQAQSTPTKIQPTVSSKACHLIIKKKPNLNLDKQPGQKIPMSEIKVLPQSKESVKVVPKKQFIVAPSATQKALHSSKLLHTKPAQSTPKAHMGLGSPNMNDKLVVISSNQPPPIHKTFSNTAKNIIITSSNVTTPISKNTITVDSNNISPKTADDSTPKTILANDLKVSTKTFLLNPKSGQKMVVLPAKARAKTTLDGQTMPLIHFKGMPTTMKLVPVGSQPAGQITKTSNSNIIVSRGTLSNTITPTNTKIVSLEAVKTTSSQATTSTPKVQGVQIAPKIAGSPIVRQSTTKGSVIVVQKGTPLGKTLSFTKSGSDISKVVMGKNVNQLIQASSAQKQEPAADSKNPGGIIVLELNDQLGPTTTMSEILETHSTKPDTETADPHKVVAITEDTPVLFETQMTEESCNANSMDSLTDSTVDMAHIEEGTISSIEKEDEPKSSQKELDAKGRSSSVTDWEMELDTAVGRKEKGNDSSSLHLELCMSSDSETDGYLVKTEKAKRKPSPQDRQHDATEESSGMFGERGGLSRASRTLLSQLQDEGSSSNDSSFTLNKSKIGLEKIEKKSVKETDKTVGTLSKSEKKSPTKTQPKRMDMFSTADINLDSFEYLEGGMMEGDDMFHVGADGKSSRSNTKDQNLEMQLSQLLGDNVSNDTNNVSEMPLNK